MDAGRKSLTVRETPEERKFKEETEGRAGTTRDVAANRREGGGAAKVGGHKSIKGATKATVRQKRTG